LIVFTDFKNTWVKTHPRAASHFSALLTGDDVVLICSAVLKHTWIRIHARAASQSRPDEKM
jgi:hypothetical protein